MIDGQNLLLYRPIVNPLNGQVRIYRAIPSAIADDVVKVGAKQALEANGNAVALAEKNAAVLTAAGEDLAAAHAAGNKVFLIVPVSARAMETKESATIVVQALKALPKISQQASVAHIFDCPSDLKLDHLDDIVLPLIFYLEKFLIEPPQGLEDFTDIGACNAQGVIFDMAEEGNDEGELTTFWSRCEPRRLPIFIQNAPDEDVVPMAERYKCQGVDGTIYGADVSEIGPRTTRDALTG